MHRSCDTCTYFQHADPRITILVPHPRGQCRRRSDPWPPRHPEEWCGEWEAAAEPRPQPWYEAQDSD
jgi:hypothetical protein